MPKPTKNTAAVNLGRLSKGKPKTMTPAAMKARKLNSQKAAAKRRLTCRVPGTGTPTPAPVQPWADDED
jgi:hypothetical protein